jgi:hypothetical protein
MPNSVVLINKSIRRMRYLPIIIYLKNCSFLILIFSFDAVL